MYKSVYNHKAKIANHQHVPTALYLAPVSQNILSKFS